ncbi:hypothetical protein K432DRAFT_378600 [Lepidopterella palustris CBS 459.81]|uniref:MARVEL domain-containing protein n=1 Tax=Lepidopterella palustris CBS 459.81 TaxID=1314670 RepID=A0A8E2EIF2_9PEZI|nr:hypothetical protein K432DRAFT_378600 [Lepidopterella palustris CBS 459.81]
MTANSYYNRVGEPFQPSPLKPILLVNTHKGYSQAFQADDEIEQIKQFQIEDERLKARIRRLRLVSRILAFIISVAVFVPMTITLHKFLTTKDIYLPVQSPDGTTQMRTAWAKNPKVWPTYVYFGVAATSVLLHFIIILTYTCGVKRANNAATVANVFTWVVLISNVVVWGVAAGLYRSEKDKDGKSNDLWGWTCSDAADGIQEVFKSHVNFNTLCNSQAVSWYIGLVQVGAALLTIFIYVLVVKRRKTKKIVKESARLMEGYEPTRRL